MNFQNRNFIRGLVMMAIALLFGGIAYRHYPIGQFSRGGPGLFPFMISCILFLIGLLTVVRSHFVPPVPLNHSVKNIALVLLSLAGFAFVSEHVNMLVGIVFLVFCGTAASTPYSWVRNVKISIGLIAVAFAFKNLLGLNLPLLGQ
ncbi:tripartite tricarboxylate transporter TctB family protein [Variovorax dokdonensis]|uniref:Tripartite tricarboxylate transporter TctB family protein n=1 Tax=Variovorax dokdonensis TaxID=344883 RepID=A0ABT7N8I8_9BURK|nr:tripartite tricarboxylate transporter TctB family protein [Variovorax dokdonensis]MDM0044261.1 tripartite tricarboxylate transporter TctB family protein [Variovorax dokdonensis]